MKYKYYCSIYSLLFVYANLYGHGFGANTYVAVSNGWQLIERLCYFASQKKQTVLSFDQNSKKTVISTIKSAGRSKVSYHVKLNFDAHNNDDIICSPTQEFYVPSTKQWVPAYKLQVGDLLLSNNNLSLPIIRKIFVQEPLDIYSIEIAETHTFFVGRYSVLTHNIIIPTGLTSYAAFSFGTGAIAGGAAGSFLGPLVIAGGFIIGGLIGVMVKAFIGNHIPRYPSELNPLVLKNHEIKLKDNKRHHIFIVKGREHGFIGGPNDEDPETWWEKIKNRVIRAYETGEITENGCDFEITEPQNVNPNFGDLTIRGKIVARIINIGTAFLKNYKG